MQEDDWLGVEEAEELFRALEQDFAQPPEEHFNQRQRDPYEFWEIPPSIPDYSRAWAPVASNPRNEDIVFLTAG